jgi:hypothetical protein
VNRPRIIVRGRIRRKRRVRKRRVRIRRVRIRRRVRKRRQCQFHLLRHKDFR